GHPGSDPRVHRLRREVVHRGGEGHGQRSEGHGGVPQRQVRRERLQQGQLRRGTPPGRHLCDGLQHRRRRAGGRRSRVQGLPQSPRELRGHGSLSRLWLILGVLLGAVMLGAVGRRVDVGQVSAVLRDLEVGYAALAVVASLSFLYVKAWRWTLLLSPLRPTRVRDLLRAVCAGTAANLIVPHAGEFTRVLMVGGRQPIPASALLASIVIERLFDFAAVLFFLGAVAVASSGLPAAL